MQDNTIKICYKVLKKFGVIIFTVILIITASVCNSIEKKKSVITSATIDNQPTVIIDAGHGGFDGGAVANDGTVEKDINLTISLRLQKMLEFYGYDVIMTRSKDTSTEDIEGTIPKKKKSDLENRLKLMKDNPCSIYVSIHLNKFTTSAANGAQVFYSPKFDEAKKLGQCIQDSIVKQLQPENDRVIKQGSNSTYLMKNALVPAVIVECGFLSNSLDLRNLKDVDYQSKMAYAIANGIRNYYKM